MDEVSSLDGDDDDIFFCQDDELSFTEGEAASPPTDGCTAVDCHYAHAERDAADLVSALR